MPADRSYGEILRSARERNGFDIVTMARTLHIRPDILKAIESADFDRMPAKGYSKNMIRAYAQKLGLDEKSISSMYQQEMRSFESGHSHTSRSKRTSRAGSRASDRVSGRGRNGYRDGSERRGSRKSASFSQDLRDDRGTSPRSSQMKRSGRRDGDERNPSRQRKSQNRSGNDRPLSMAAGAVGALFASGKSLGPGRGQRIPSPYTDFSASASYGSPARSMRNTRGGSHGAFQLNLPLLILLAVAATVIIIVLVVLFNSGQQKVDEIPDIPISGLTDTSSPEDEQTFQPASVAPTHATFTVEVPQGEKSWMEIIIDDDDPIVSEVVRGPYEESFEVTGTLTFKTANPDPVVLTLDGETVKAKKGSSSQYYTYTVDFPALLREWERENNGDTSTGSTGSNRSGDASNRSSSASNTSNTSDSGNSNKSSSSSRSSASSRSSSSSSED